MDTQTPGTPPPQTPVQAPSPVSPPLTTPEMKAPVASTLTFVLVGVGAIVLVGMTGFYFGRQSNNAPPLPAPTASPDVQPTGPDQGVACTMDALECPDGSFVGRIAPNCEFAKCPGGQIPTASPSSVILPGEITPAQTQ